MATATVNPETSVEKSLEDIVESVDFNRDDLSTLYQLIGDMKEVKGKDFATQSLSYHGHRSQEVTDLAEDVFDKFMESFPSKLGQNVVTEVPVLAKELGIASQGYAILLDFIKNGQYTNKIDISPDLRQKVEVLALPHLNWRYKQEGAYAEYYYSSDDTLAYEAASAQADLGAEIDKIRRSNPLLSSEVI